MADVRLTATNPEDSSVVPVACDAAGRLLLEEPQVIEGPPGPPGEQGPPGQDGDPFSGNFAGDVNFGGSATFAGVIKQGSYDSSSANGRGAYIGSGYIIGQQPAAAIGAIPIWQGRYGAGDNAVTSEIFANGNAKFAGTVSAKSFVVTGGSGGPSYTPLTLNNDGSATFAGGKAGFTAEGYLWCTTERGDTVMLQATVGGAGLWVDYTPTTRLEEIRDKLDANRGDTGEMPADTQ